MIASPEVLLTYMKPEEVELLDNVDYQAQDVYSLGCLLVWLLAGREPVMVTEQERETKKLDTPAKALKRWRGKQKRMVQPFC